jgi:hypothetical protein
VPLPGDGASTERTGSRVLTRTYAGNDQRDAVRRFAVDAEAMAALGYRVSSHRWEPGRRDAASRAIPGVLVPKHGILTVTYAPRGPAPARSDPTADALGLAPAGAGADLVELLSLRASGVISDRQFQVMRRRLVPRS